MKNIIVVDSGIDLPQDLIEKHQLLVMPLLVYIDDVEYRDGVDITPKELMEKMNKGALPKTAQIPYGVMEETINPLLADGSQVFYLTLSSGLSGTYQTAKLLEDTLCENGIDGLHVIDSKSASLGLGMIAIRASDHAKNIIDAQEVKAQIHLDIKAMKHLLYVGNLDTLYKGGRVSKSAAMVGNIMNVKPILTMKDGRLEVIDKVRGIKRSTKKIIELLRAHENDLEDAVIGINHGDRENDALMLKEIVSSEFGSKKFILHDVGAAIGAHTGPGLIALYAFKNDRSL